MNEGAPKPLAVVVLIDALGWEIAKHFEFCRELLPNAAQLDTVLGYSSAAIPSLLSGELPARHGSWAMYRYAPTESPFWLLRHIPKLPHALEWRFRVLVKWFLKKRNTIRGYYDLYEIPLPLLGHFDVAQRGDPYTPGGMNCETLFDRLVERDVPFKVWTYRTPEADNFDDLIASVDSDNAFLFFYTADLDEMMHRVGIHADAVKTRLKTYEDRIRTIIERARAAGRPLSLFLFSDHGMTPVTRSVDLMGEVGKWGYRFGEDFMAFFDSTMARFWCKPESRLKLIERLNATGWGRVIPESELETFGCRFDDPSYGDIIFLVSPGILIVPSFMGSEAIDAMHGYHPDDRYSRGCFMTNRGDTELPVSIMDLKSYLLERIDGAT